MIKKRNINCGSMQKYRLVGIFYTVSRSAMLISLWLMCVYVVNLL